MILTGRPLKATRDQCRVPGESKGPVGDVEVANGAFAYFFHREDEASRAGLSVMDPRFLRIHPELPEDLEKVVNERKIIRRSLAFKGGSDETVEFIFTLSPLKGEAQKLLLSIIRV